MSLKVGTARNRSHRFAVWVGLVTSLSLTACGTSLRPAVPMQPGKTIFEAREDLRICELSTSESWRMKARRRSVDKCLAEKGYQRRELTVEEQALLNRADLRQREFLLQHLMEGGTLQEFRDTYLVEQ